MPRSGRGYFGSAASFSGPSRSSARSGPVGFDTQGESHEAVFGDPSGAAVLLERPQPDRARRQPPPHPRLRRGRRRHARPDQPGGSRQLLRPARRSGAAPARRGLRRRGARRRCRRHLPARSRASTTGPTGAGTSPTRSTGGSSAGCRTRPAAGASRPWRVAATPGGCASASARHRRASSGCRSSGGESCAGSEPGRSPISSPSGCHFEIGMTKAWVTTLPRNWRTTPRSAAESRRARAACDRLRFVVATP